MITFLQKLSVTWQCYLSFYKHCILVLGCIPVESMAQNYGCKDASPLHKDNLTFHLSLVSFFHKVEWSISSSRKKALVLVEVDDLSKN